MRREDWWRFNDTPMMRIANFMVVMGSCLVAIVLAVVALSWFDAETPLKPFTSDRCWDICIKEDATEIKFRYGYLMNADPQGYEACGQLYAKDAVTGALTCRSFYDACECIIGTEDRL